MRAYHAVVEGSGTGIMNRWMVSALKKNRLRRPRTRMLAPLEMALRGAAIVLGDTMEVAVGLVDYSEQALHLSLEMHNSAGKLCAHHETIVLHVTKDTENKPLVSEFSPKVKSSIKQFDRHYGRISGSPYCSKPLGIRRK